MTLMTTGLYTVVRPSTFFWSQDIGAYVTPLRHRNARAPRMFECPAIAPTATFRLRVSRQSEIT